MTIYLWEHVHPMPGQIGNYIRGVAERWLPLGDKYDDANRLCGFFVPGVLNSKQPAVYILWSLGDWDGWRRMLSKPDAEELLIKTTEFFMPAQQWRSGWTDKIIEKLPFSPEPPIRPEYMRQGNTVIDHKFVIRPDKCEAFVETMQNDVIPAAAEIGLHLELFARVVGRPMEYDAIWSIETQNDYRKWRMSLDVTKIAAALPRFEKAWATLVDMEERESSPVWFSPIGGTGVSPHGASATDVAV